ncbi:glycoside hydrolase family 2 protein [Actinacidiphila acididurans]|uniref:Glycoside hydrolase family 2 n=1 Tax=Actinacidiphila acididurans TaxID=2784346 RepID=A0ABS2TMG0_9ACTN|nr:glycoside hydrolase family 2 TIM barrel-domain containing protein [Actinacidiphila acididurans]MBM9503435.1 glycoside hydrolase family 2 [Actinacidiphila acididurans]
MSVSRQDGSYPRPMLRRERWHSLDGVWDFGYDDADAGEREAWFGDDARPAAPGPAAAAGPSGALSTSDPSAPDPFDRRITVPFPPEAPASGIGETAPHRVVWYRRRIPHAVLAPAAGERSLVHFGAVDHRARVWLDGRLVAEHIGGQTPFTADVTDALRPGATEHVLVVRAEDDPADLAQPRGKQDWRDRPHAVWYERTTGIWQSVWAETVPVQHIADLAWTADPARGVLAEVTLARTPQRPVAVEIVLSLDGRVLAETSAVVGTPRARVDVVIPALGNGIDREDLLWHPERPVLLDARVTVREAGAGTGEVVGSADPAAPVDMVDSYVGLRSVGVGGGAFLLNDRPYYVRSVLNQGYRTDTLLASRGSDELRREVELIKAMGFNAVRIHQKVEDPRFLHWADRLGLLVWGETGAAYEFSAHAVELLTREWLEIVRRDRSHPSIVTWVPINESWGASDIAHDTAQRHYSIALANLTRAVDPSRPVVSNEGWEHTDSDILGVHDYSGDPQVLTARYGGTAGFSAQLTGLGPQGRRLSVTAGQTERYAAGDAPLMITEFGGLSLAADEGEFSYTRTSSDTQYAALLSDLFAALRDSPLVAGFCYTQFMDTAQETNGLLFPDGTPKLPLETIHRIVTGLKDPSAPA